MSDNLREFFRQHDIELNGELKEKLDEYGVERVSDIAWLTEQELKQAGKLYIKTVYYIATNLCEFCNLALKCKSFTNLHTKTTLALLYMVMHSYNQG